MSGKLKILHSKITSDKGSELLILHGFLGMGDNWKTYANVMTKLGYRTHLIDQRNHGRSFHSDEFNYELMSSDLYNYINYYKIKKIDPKKEIVIGFGITEKTIGKLKSADGLVVGSAICKEISKSLKHRQNPVTNVSKLVKKLKNKIL